MTITPPLTATPPVCAAIRRAALTACLIALSASTAHADHGEIHPPGLPCGYTVEIIERPQCPDPLNPAVIWVQGLNEAGTVVGYRRGCWDLYQKVPWIWQPGDGAPTDIAVPADVYSAEAYDINDDGVICGRFRRESEPWRGFVYDTNTGEWTELEPVDPTGSGTASANAINNAGVVAGTRSIGESQNPYNAFIWSADDGYTDLGVMQGPYSTALDINERGVVTGWTGSSFVSGLGYLRVDGTTQFLGTPDDSDTSIPNAINGGNTVVGTSHWYHSSGEIDQHAVVWDGEVAIVENLKGYNRCGGVDVSDKGIVVGSCTASGVPGWESFLWHQGNMVSMDEISLHGSRGQIDIEKASTINNSGQVLTRGKVDSGSTVGLLLTPTESPIGDLTGDCNVDGNDLALLLSEWDKKDSPADLTGNGSVGGADLGVLLSNWTK